MPFLTVEPEADEAEEDEDQADDMTNEEYEEEQGKCWVPAAKKAKDCQMFVN